MRIVIDILVIISIVFALAGVVGMIRMPDAYTRMQSSTNVSTLGIIGVLIGAILYAIIYLGDTSMAIKLAFLMVFYLITSPISGHAIAKGAYRHGVKMSEKTVCDHYGKDLVPDSIADKDGTDCSDGKCQAAEQVCMGTQSLQAGADLVLKAENSKGEDER